MKRMQWPWWLPPSWFAARIIWQIVPNIWTCGAFWLVTFGWPFVFTTGERKRRRNEPVKPVDYVLIPAVLLVAAGALMNAVVTLANGGFMPVGSNFDPETLGASLWVTSTDAHRLRWMGDNFAGFSLGDFAIFGGLVCGLAHTFLTRGSRQPSHEDPDVFKRPVTLGFARVWLGVSVFASSADFWGSAFWPCVAMFATWPLVMAAEWHSRRSHARQTSERRRCCVSIHYSAELP